MRTKTLNERVNEICEMYGNDEERIIRAANALGQGIFLGWYGAAVAIAEACEKWEQICDTK